jgi:hypothetical protein
LRALLARPTGRQSFNRRLNPAATRTTAATVERRTLGEQAAEECRAKIPRLAAHRRVELLAHYNGRPNSPWDIASQAQSRAA